MNTEIIARSTWGKLFMKVVAAGMQSRFRYRFFSPLPILKRTDLQSGQTVLEVGCGTGYFTVPAAQLIGEQGCLVAMDVLPASVKMVSEKVQRADLKNVRVVSGDALETGLDADSFDTVLLLGVIPAPMLPLVRLLPEMHRVLKVGGNLAVWPPFPGWLPRSILNSGLFAFANKVNGVYNFKNNDKEINLT
jgi:ubiquinone/menaquinone biosynthesis C-methylase UbiE